ncbi:MAG: HD domain-containing protein [Armatimonadetes bacterium]|nr:HD domain-containing protein [Armatimonadota bacterium]
MNSESRSSPTLRDDENTPLQRLERLAEPWLERLTEPSHDGEHVRRVLRLAERLGAEDQADGEILRAAALLHDLGRALPESSRPHVELSVEIAHDLLERSGFPPEKRDVVLHCIRAHSYSRGIPPETLEAKILRDADRLDALGVMGIIRTFSYGGTFYDPADPLARKKTLPEGEKYCVEHFYEKLFKLPDGLYTEAARRIAKDRVAFMEEFLARLEREAVGES